MSSEKFIDMINDFYLPRVSPSVISYDGYQKINSLDERISGYTNNDNNELYNINLGNTKEELEDFCRFLQETNNLYMQSKQGDYLSYHSPVYTHNDIRFIEPSFTFSIKSKSIVFVYEGENINIKELFNIYVREIVDKIGLGE